MNFAPPQNPRNKPISTRSGIVGLKSTDIIPFEELRRYLAMNVLLETPVNMSSDITGSI